MKTVIDNMVHDLYWKNDINCARTTLRCLSELFLVELTEQTVHAAIGLHGAGGFRAQCGLVEGALMFIGIYYKQLGKQDAEIAALCYQYAEVFSAEFGSMLCFDLRPGGFSEYDPPHACEELTARTIEFAYSFIKGINAGKRFS